MYSASWTHGGDKVRIPTSLSAAPAQRPSASAPVSPLLQVVLSGRRPFFYVYDALAGVATKVPGLAGRSEKSLERLCVSPGEGLLTAFTLSDGWLGVVDNRTSRLATQVKALYG